MLILSSGINGSILEQVGGSTGRVMAQQGEARVAGTEGSRWVRESRDLLGSSLSPWALWSQQGGGLCVPGRVRPQGFSIRNPQAQPAASSTHGPWHCQLGRIFSKDRYVCLCVSLRVCVCVIYFLKN